MGKAVDQPVYNLIGGLSQARLPLEWSISMADDNAKMVADAQRATQELGIGVLCIKAGHPKGWQRGRENFIAVREAVGPDVSIGMDPNTGWTVTDTIRTLRALKACASTISSSRSIVLTSRAWRRSGARQPACR